MEKFDEAFLFFFSFDAFGDAEILVFFVGDEVGFHCFELGFEVEVGGLKFVFDVGDLVDLFGDFLAEFFESFSGCAGGCEDGAEGGIFFAEAAFVEIEGVNVVLVADDDDGGL